MSPNEETLNKHQRAARVVLLDQPHAPELEEYEETLYRGHKWWTIDGLRDLDDLVAPESLAELLAPLAAGEIPDVAEDL